MSRLRATARQNLPTLMKTGSYYLIHICVAALVAYAVTSPTPGDRDNGMSLVLTVR